MYAHAFMRVMLVEVNFFAHVCIYVKISIKKYLCNILCHVKNEKYLTLIFCLNYFNLRRTLHSGLPKSSSTHL